MRYAFIIICLLTSTLLHSIEPSKGLRNWRNTKYKVLNPMNRTPSRTAVLIIAPPKIGNSLTEHRWNLGKATWKQYMNAVPNVDCYFVQSANPRRDSSEQVWIDGDTIYVGDTWYENYGNDRILHKTIAAIEQLLPHYTHFIRTNLNSFFNLKAVYEYAEMHPQSMFTGPLWQKEWYVVGYGILFTADVASHMVNEYKRLEGSDAVSHHHSDDCVLTSLATGIFPFEHSKHVFRCCPTLPLGIRQLMCRKSFSTTRLSQYGALLLPPISLDLAKQYCDAAANTVLLYRIREGLQLEELAELYEHLLYKIYPELPASNLVEYSRSLSTL